MPEDEENLPGAQKDDVKDIGGDPAQVSSDSDSEEAIDYQDDEEMVEKVHTHVFVVDMVTRYPD